MDYIVLAHPHVDVSAERFVQEWNQNDESSKLAAATRVDPSSKVYDGGLSILLGVIGAVASGVVSNAIFALIMQAARRSSKKQETTFEIKTEQRDDGTTVVRILPLRDK